MVHSTINFGTSTTKLCNKKGMIIGNHSYFNHMFSTLSIESCIEEIEKCESIIEKLYIDAGVVRKYKPLRFPYGDKGGVKTIGTLF